MARPDPRAPNHPTKAVVLFAGRVLLFYLLFTALWPLGKETYREAFAAAGEGLFGSFGRYGVVTFDRFEKVEGSDIRILLRNRRTQAWMTHLRDSRYTSYGPASLLAALVLATPLPWRRRWRTLVWGLILIHLFIASTLWLLLLDSFSNGNLLTVIHLPAPLKFLVAVGAIHLALFPTAPHAAPFIVWGLVTFRRGDWGLLLPQQQPKMDKVGKPQGGDQ